MALKKRWLAGTRQGQLDMTRTWLRVFAEETAGDSGRAVKKHEAWGIPAATVAEFGTLYSTAEEALTKAKEKETRTEVVNVACRNAFTALVEAMKAIKRRWLLSPPLSEEDLVSLGLKIPDKKLTHYGAPTARQVPVIIKRGQGSLSLRFEYVEGDPYDRANKSRRFWYNVVAPGGAPPATPYELTESEPRNRITETITFGYGDSGKTVYMAVQFENGDFKGPFGPMISAIIP